MSKDKNSEDEVIYDTIELDLGDGETMECGVLSKFVYGSYDYIAVFPVETDEDGMLNIFYYRYSEDEKGNPIIENIPDDEEYEAVADTFDKIIDDMEFDEVIDEDELDD